MMAGVGKVAVVIGASRGVGYSIGKELALRLPNANIKLTTERQDNLQVLKRLLGDEIGIASKKCEYRQLALTESRGVRKLVDVVKAKHGVADILVNNSSIYYKPPAAHHSYGVPEVNDAFVKEAQQCIRTNYTAFKDVISRFLPIMADNSRIVNIGSHLGMIRNIPGSSLRQAFTQPDITEKDLDDLIDRFLLAIKEGTHELGGWPSCSYTVSKIAVNSYTGILQKRLDQEMPDRGIVVNCVHTGDHSSKMKLKQESLVDGQEDAAEAVAYLATHGMSDVQFTSAKNAALDEMPRGKIFWPDLQEINWSPERISPRSKSSTN